MLRVKLLFFYDDIYGPNGSHNNMYDNRQVLSCNNLECIQKYAISNGNYISKICTILPGQSSCNSITNSLTILFQRPNPEALIYPDVETNGTGVNNQASYADITVSSPNGTKRYYCY